MVRLGVVLFFAGALASNVALGQCRGGAGQGGSPIAAGTTGVSQSAGLLGLGGGGVSTLQGSGSLAYQAMMSQIIAQQMAQQHAVLAMRQQQVKAEKLATRKYRAEQSRSQVAESRARARASLAAQNGLQAANKPAGTMVAYNAVRR
jgi:hypothetical protein